MTTSTSTSNPTAIAVELGEDTFSVSLSDGRVVIVPLSWYPRLSHSLPEHRAIWKFVGAGHGIHWPEVDEDISVENILFGQPSGEGARSFSRWKEWYQKKVSELRDRGRG